MLVKFVEFYGDIILREEACDRSDEPLGRADFVPSSEVVASVHVGEFGMFSIPLVMCFGNSSKVPLHGSRSFLVQMGAGLKNMRQSIDYVLEGGSS
ncbi:hypothetical protein VD0002_g7767 [Verticillium dahliae]|nr:hypothetical protein VD0003_g6882 [Verticillium dahliae]PNH59818.1 hypothetical protein VD0002_g7767 [Verticillium dahliae]